MRDEEPGRPENAPGLAHPWSRRIAIGIGISVAIFIVIDGLFGFLLRASGALSATAAVTGWNPTMYAIWAVVAAFAGAAYALAPLGPNSAAGWAWRAAGGVALAGVLYLILDTQVWYYLNPVLPAGFPISSWPAPLYDFWLALAVLLGARFVLARARLFSAAWWGWRIVGGVALALATYFALVWFPLFLITTAQANGVPLPNLTASLSLIGSLFAVLTGAAYAAHPTRYYGPIEIGAGVLEIFYLVFLVGTAPYVISVRSLALSVSTVAILLGLIVVLVLSMAGDVVATFEDFARPGERRDWQYPLPSDSGDGPP